MNDNRGTELAKNTVILGLGRFLPRLVSIVTLPIVTARLTQAEYGTYDLILTLIMLVIPIATLQIQSAAFRFLIEQRGDKEESSRIISNIYIVTVPISAVASFVIFWVFPGLSVPIRLAAALYFLLDSLVNTTGMVVRGIGGNSDYAISSIVLSVVNGVGIVLAVSVLDQGLLGVMVSLDVANFVAWIYLVARKRIFQFFSRVYFSAQKIKELIAYSWPMVPNNLSNWVLRVSDRFVITAFLGVDANGVYAVANRIPNILSIAQGVLVAAWQENASLAVNDEDAEQYFTKMFDWVFSLMVGCTALLIAATPLIFALLIRGDYDDAYPQMPILILGMFFYAMSAFQGGIYVAHKRTRNVGITTIVAAGINLAVDFALVNRIGITAGSISTVVAYFVLYVFRSINSKRFQPINYHVKKQILCIIPMIIMLFLCFMRNTYLDLINVAAGITMFLVLNWGITKSAVRRMVHRIRHREKGLEGKADLTEELKVEEKSELKESEAEQETEAEGEAELAEIAEMAEEKEEGV